MSKTRSVAVDYAVYLVVRLLVCVIQALTLRGAYELATGLAWVLYRLDRRHRLVALENLRHAFPHEYTEAELDRLVRATYAHFCKLMIEIVHLPRQLHSNNWRRYMNIDGCQQLVECMLSGRPLLILCGHFGNWEMAGYCMCLFGFPGHAIARPLDNPYVDDFLRRFREHTGQKVLAKKGDFDNILTILKGGGVLGTMVDQDAGPRGVFVDFFGRPASTHKAPALLALEHRVPMLVSTRTRVGEPMRYVPVVADVIYPEDYDGHPDAVRAITERYTSALEAQVRRTPEQYFWLHRRWKHQPARPRRRVA